MSEKNGTDVAAKQPNEKRKFCHFFHLQVNVHSLRNIILWL